MYRQLPAKKYLPAPLALINSILSPAPSIIESGESVKADANKTIAWRLCEAKVFQANQISGNEQETANTIAIGSPSNACVSISATFWPVILHFPLSHFFHLNRPTEGCLLFIWAASFEAAGSVRGLSAPSDTLLS
jgi:hypothetical protein